MSPIDYRKQLTERIINQLEQGTAPWVKPWTGNSVVFGVPENAVTGRLYHGGNRIWLDCHGYDDPRWCTYRQAQAAGWQVRKGEKAAVVEYWQWEKDAKDESGQSVRVKLDSPRVFYSHIFNAEQIEGIPERTQPEFDWIPEVAAENILQASGAVIKYDKTDQAFYSPGKDQIHMPPPIAFKSAAEFYGTALHELSHWTGHKSRLDRELVNSFGSPDYAREELRAELSSYFLSAQLGIPHNPGNHASYIASWIKVLGKDHNEIFRAAKDAEKIAEFVMEFQKQHVKEKSQNIPRMPELEDELEC